MARQSQAPFNSGFHIEGTYPESAGHLMTALLRGLADIECKYEREHDQILHWMIPEIIKCQLLRDLETKHGLECKPYVQRLSQMYGHLLDATVREAGAGRS